MTMALCYTQLVGRTTVVSCLLMFERAKKPNRHVCLSHGCPLFLIWQCTCLCIIITSVLHLEQRFGGSSTWLQCKSYNLLLIWLWFTLVPILTMLIHIPPLCPTLVIVQEPSPLLRLDVLFWHLTCSCLSIFIESHTTKRRLLPLPKKLLMERRSPLRAKRSNWRDSHSPYRSTYLQHILHTIIFFSSFDILIKILIVFPERIIKPGIKPR